MTFLCSWNAKQKSCGNIFQAYCMKGKNFLKNCVLLNFGHLYELAIVQCISTILTSKGYAFYMGKGILEDANNNNQSRKYMKFAKNEE